MTNKIISSVMLTTSIVFLVLANANPDNLLFLFVSSESMVSIARVVLALGMVLLSFRRIITSKSGRNFVKLLGFGLIAFGGYSISVLGGVLYDYFKLLDVFIIAEAGVIFTLCALTTTIELHSTATKEAAKAPAPALQQHTV